MADQAAIDTVKLNLPAWAQEIAAWDDVKIGSVLDTLAGNVSRVVRQFWLARVNDTSALTDVADVGASRPLSQTYQHAQEMLAYWDRLSGQGGAGSSVGNIKTRYPRHHHGQGLSREGVYVRSD